MYSVFFPGVFVSAAAFCFLNNSLTTGAEILVIYANPVGNFFHMLKNNIQYLFFFKFKFLKNLKICLCALSCLGNCMILRKSFINLSQR